MTLLSGVSRIARFWLARILLRGTIAAADQVKTRGLTTVLAYKEDDWQAVVARIDAALQDIQDVDARLFSRLSRDLKFIFVSQAGGPEFVAPIRACMLSYPTVKRLGKEALALVMVHEAIHARLWLSGIEYDATNRDRVELRCIAEEIYFAQKADYPPELLEWTAEKKRRSHQWSDDSLRNRRDSELKDFGVPKWLRRLLM